MADPSTSVPRPRTGGAASPSGTGGLRASEVGGAARDGLRRFLLVGTVLVAVGLFVAAGFAADTDAPRAGSSGTYVERLEPAPGTESFGQAPIRIDLAPGWALASLEVNGVPIPEAEWQVTPALGLYQFLPADGKAVAGYQSQRNTVQAEVFPVQDPADRRPVSWTFDSL